MVVSDLDVCVEGKLELSGLGVPELGLDVVLRSKSGSLSVVRCGEHEVGLDVVCGDVD